MRRTFRPEPVWICFAAFCTCVGWGLSLLHQLNAAGYCVVFSLGLAGFALWWWKAHPRVRSLVWFRFRKRFSRLIPAIFLIFAVIAFLEGILYSPRYYDALAYRVPRVLHWLAAGQWHWIHTGFQRVNARGCGAEWLSAPIIALFKSDRPLFLFTAFIPFCLMPGLIFSSLTRIGVNRRVAYAWMWLLPLGCCFLFQASDLGNDLLAATFMIAGLAFVLRGKQEGSVGYLWLSLLAVSLGTGVKATTLPLMLVWVLIAAQCWRLWSSRIAGTVVIGIIAATVSFLPTAFFNQRYSHDWTGSLAENQSFTTPNPVARMVGNVGMVATLNLEPPVAPFAKAWNERIAPKLIPTKLERVIRANLQQVDRSVLGIDEMQTDISGLGLEICGLLIFATVAARVLSRNYKLPKKTLNWTQRLVIAGTAVAFLAFLKSAFVVSIARLMAPCYIFLAIPFLLVSGHEFLVRRRGWYLAVLAAAFLAAIPFVLRPDRPIVPVTRMLSLISQKMGPRPWLARAATVYEVYGRRGEAFQPAVEMLPSGTRVAGVVTFDDPETSLWKPFGSRRIFHVCPDDTSETLEAKGVKYILVGEYSFHLVFSGKLDDWLKRIHGTIVKTTVLRLRAGQEPTTWDLVQVGS